MTSTRYDIDAKLAADAFEQIQASFPGPSHLVLIAIPTDDDETELGQPSFMSTFDPGTLRHILLSIAMQIPDAGSLIVTDTFSPNTANDT